MNEAVRKRQEYLASLPPDPPKPKEEPTAVKTERVIEVRGDKLPGIKLLNLILAQVCVHVENDRKDEALDLTQSLIATLNGDVPDIATMPA